MNAVGYYQDDFSPKRLLPQDLIGQHFLQYFHHGWSFLEADMPEWGERPKWRTETRYPLQPRNLWSDYNDDETLLGLSFGSQTNYMLLDIDRTSVNHPYNDRKRYHGILETMESIGLCRDVPVRSSESEGIHLYYFLPESVHSFTLAATVKHTVEEAGYKVQGGQLEIFPNAKPYNVGRPTSFRCHRLPLQRGSYLLNWDLEPESNSVATLLGRADLSAAGQDLAILIAAMEQVWQHLKKQYPRRGKGNVQQWYNHLQEQIQEGFSGFGQTNTLLLSTACFGIVFLRLGGRDLYDYVLDSITSSANYHHYCRHQHEIDVRVTDVVRSAQRYYYPYKGKPPRDKTYQEHFGGAGEGERGKIIVFPHPSRKRREETIQRISAVVALLKGAEEFPASIQQRSEAIIAKSKEAFGVGVSQTTLHKVDYMRLWHPDHEIAQEIVPTEERVNPDSPVLKYPIYPSPWDEEGERVNPVVAKVSKDLHVPPIYEGLKCLPAAAGGEAEKSAALDTVQDHESQGEAIPEAGNSEDSAQDTNSSNSSNSSNSKILHPRSPSETIHFPLFNVFLENVCRVFLLGILTILNHKYFQYPPVAAAKPEKSDIPHKQPLSIQQTPMVICTNPPPSGETFWDSRGDSKLDSNGCGSIDSRLDSDTDAVPPMGSVPESIPHSPPNSIPVPDSRLPRADTPDTLDVSVFSPEDSPPVVSCPSCPEMLLDGEASENSSEPSAPTYTPEQYREAIRFRLHALPQAKHWVRTFCNMEGIALMPAQREQLEQFVRYRLMRTSPSPMLQEEAAAWFAAHEEVTAQIKSFGMFWEYCQNLQ
jgi:hypothetical protein